MWKRCSHRFFFFFLTIDVTEIPKHAYPPPAMCTSTSFYYYSSFNVCCLSFCAGLWHPFALSTQARRKRKKNNIKWIVACYVRHVRSSRMHYERERARASCWWTDFSCVHTLLLFAVLLTPSELLLLLLAFTAYQPSLYIISENDTLCASESVRGWKWPAMSSMRA